MVGSLQGGGYRWGFREPVLVYSARPSCRREDPGCAVLGFLLGLESLILTGLWRRLFGLRLAFSVVASVCSTLLSQLGAYHSYLGLHWNVDYGGDRYLGLPLLDGLGLIGITGTALCLALVVSFFQTLAQRFA